MNSVHLTGVALAALLSENFILVNCMGIGTQFDAFHHPRTARRTCSDAVHGGDGVLHLDG